MGNPAGVKRDFIKLEQRRLAAAKLLQKGFSQAAVARRIGVHRQSVSRWAKALHTSGRPALKRAGRAGRKPRLTSTDFQTLAKALKEGPLVLGYATQLWTCQRVAHLIKQTTGVQYHPDHVWRILRSLGWSCQRPTGRALERDEKAISHWKRYRWPVIKKKPVQRGAPLSLSTKVA